MQAAVLAAVVVPVVTPVYAALLALMLVVLAGRVIAARVRVDAMHGDGGDVGLRRRIRAHANFAKYTPLALLLMALMEMAGATPGLLHGLGSMLLACRILHAIGMARTDAPNIARFAGMVGTFMVLVVGALRLLAAALGLV